MTQLVFWQTVGAVYFGNFLFALAAYMVWRVSREERGFGKRVPVWVFAAGLLGPAAALFAFATLP
ncbi:hypothetical protein C9E82_00100 [Paracoccus siganidrum]|nr:hypothetical protein C9E82_00100 [Paracoccus siganidrum]